MPGIKEKVYWDTCIFIAWIKNERRSNPLEMDGILECVERAERGETLIVTGQIVKPELMTVRLETEQRALLDRLMMRRCAQILSDNPRIMDLAGEIRAFYLDQGHGKTLSVPDAVHLATAIYYRVDAFYTFDKGKRGGLGLLQLDGNVGGHNLHICKPPVTQGRLHFN